MIAQVIQILTNEGQRMTSLIKERTPKVTGKMANSVGYEVTSTATEATLAITARPFFRVVETGRKPTPDKKPSKAMIENISEWLQAQGKDQKLAWAIATAINKKGTKLWQKGGRKDIFSDVFSDKNISKLERSLLDALADYTLREFLDNLQRNKLVDGRIST